MHIIWALKIMHPIIIHSDIEMVILLKINKSGYFNNLFSPKRDGLWVIYENSLLTL
jgi:hypothetical protein